MSTFSTLSMLCRSDRVFLLLKPIAALLFYGNQAKRSDGSVELRPVDPQVEAGPHVDLHGLTKEFLSAVKGEPASDVMTGVLDEQLQSGVFFGGEKEKHNM